MKKTCLLLSTLLTCLLFSPSNSWAQSSTDSLTGDSDPGKQAISRKPQKPIKISHAEPLYLDLVRDLGARKGEKEWNVGTELSYPNGAMQWHPFVEYEFAPVNRLGMEVEVPFHLTRAGATDTLSHKGKFGANSLKTSLQWTFLVSQRFNTSLAIGYTNELAFAQADENPDRRIFSAEGGHPFLVVAKKWGSRFHTLLYASAGFEKEFSHTCQPINYEINTALHYAIPRSNALVGLEMYQHWTGQFHETILRPQVRIAVGNNLKVGLVMSVAVNGPEPTSSFIRLVYELKNKSR